MGGILNLSVGNAEGKRGDLAPFVATKLLCSLLHAKQMPTNRIFLMNFRGMTSPDRLLENVLLHEYAVQPIGQG